MAVADDTSFSRPLWFFSSGRRQQTRCRWSASCKEPCNLQYFFIAIKRAYFRNRGSDLCLLRSALLRPLRNIAERRGCRGRMRKDEPGLIITHLVASKVMSIIICMGFNDMPSASSSNTVRRGVLFVNHHCSIVRNYVKRNTVAHTITIFV